MKIAKIVSVIVVAIILVFVAVPYGLQQYLNYTFEKWGANENLSPTYQSCPNTPAEAAASLGGTPNQWTQTGPKTWESRFPVPEFLAGDNRVMVVFAPDTNKGTFIGKKVIWDTDAKKYEVQGLQILRQEDTTPLSWDGNPGTPGYFKVHFAQFTCAG